MESAIAVERYFRAWNETDDEARLALQAEAWTDECLYVDPNGRFNGREAINAMMAGTLVAFPGATLSRTSMVEAHEEFLRFNWTMVDAAGGPIVAGVDFGELAPDGRLRQIVGYFGVSTTTAEEYVSKSLDASRVVAAPRELVWDLISDQRLYGEIAMNLSSAEIIGGEGVGMIRQCTNAQGQSWRETCIDWQEGYSYAFEVDTSNYPYPLAKVTGTWAVEEVGNGTRIKMHFDFEPIDGPEGEQYVRAGKVTFPAIAEGILDQWEEMAHTRAAASSAA
jgi:hypothetical protein